jgi:16S rRNA (cytosine967-C5)-methyltransferase
VIPVSDTAAVVLADAARALGRVVAGSSADDVLRHESSQSSAVRAISLGSLRWYWRLKALVDTLLADTHVTPPVRALLVVAIHQLEYSRNPPEAVVSSSVDAVRILRQPRAAGLVNALLRRFLRERESLTARALTEPAALAAHPRWLFDLLRQHWPDDWQTIVDSDNLQPPMTLRVNLARGSRQDYLARLAQQGLHAHALEWSHSALVLESAVPVTQLPGFAQGEASVQDAGSQLASVLLDAQPGQRVLDACAAPGGKTGAILEQAAGIDLTAIDIDSVRAVRISDNLKRIGAQARVLTADLREDASWWDGAAFDRILLDAPCSATGVIRRHPDIKLLRQPRDIAGFADTQRRLLRRALGWLKPGGRLLYCTCSVIAAENDDVVETILREHPQVRSVPLPAVALPPQSRSLSRGTQLLPGNAAQTDGFYYACLTVT